MPAGRTTTSTPEHERLEQSRTAAAPWKAWGPYLSERQWGTVREDYSGDGDAWNYFTHDHSRSRAYRWGEDGIAGLCDERQRLCLALALWNGADPILKERMFGLSNGEGNHGEDVKEYWFYLDSTPTHSYLKCQYKYPQRAFPYMDLISTNARRTKQDMEYELLDTGVFDDDRYFDVVVEYAKAAPDDILMVVTAYNRGPDHATLHLLPTLWFRNTWSWGDAVAKPAIAALAGPPGLAAARASHEDLGDWVFRADASAELLFCENETNSQRLFGTPNASPYVKDGINDYVVNGGAGAVNPDRTGTKMAALHVLEIAPGESAEIRVRLTGAATRPTAASGPAGTTGASATGAAGDGTPSADPLGSGFDRVLSARKAEADTFYATVIPPALSADQALVMRQALAGLLWGKQYYEYDVHRWLREHGVDPWGPNAPTSGVRNVQWFHMIAGDIISMPDKWEYPWFAAWDLAFHCAPLSLVDIDFAKEQVELLLKTRYLHPNGQIPAYEWNFGDVNPPVTAVGGAVRLRARGGDPRRGRSRVPRSRVRPAPDQLHLVGQPQGPRRPQPVPGRVPGPGQHRDLRSLGATARRRPARAGGRHRLDGPLLPVDAPDRDRAGPRTARLRRHGAQVHRPLHVDLGGDEPTRGRCHALGRRGRLLLRRDADAGRARRSS